MLLSFDCASAVSVRSVVKAIKQRGEGDADIL
jgi:hypothetical protein